MISWLITECDADVNALDLAGRLPGEANLSLEAPNLQYTVLVIVGGPLETLAFSFHSPLEVVTHNSARSIAVHSAEENKNYCVFVLSLIHI